MFVIGIAGGTGSGKTTFTENLVDMFREDVAVIHHDNYYNVLDHLSYEERCKVNYDHPDSFETKLMVEHIKKLKNGERIEEPVYDFTVHNRDKTKTITLEPKKILIIDGILVLENKELCELMDLKIFVDTDADIRLGRRILRDMTERGRSIESVLTQYQTTVKPMHDKFVEPSKKNADIVILEGGKNKAAIDLFAGYIREYLKKEN
ncbi:MAG: uridine kinase [Oscillospiraceae bacterium]|nr:uridine kinase [Oscillospiraceae bacterium]